MAVSGNLDTGFTGCQNLDRKAFPDLHSIQQYSISVIVMTIKLYSVIFLQNCQMLLNTFRTLSPGDRGDRCDSHFLGLLFLTSTVYTDIQVISFT